MIFFTLNLLKVCISPHLHLTKLYNPFAEFALDVISFILLNITHAHKNYFTHTHNHSSNGFTLDINAHSLTILYTSEWFYKCRKY